MAEALKCDVCGSFYELLTDFRKYRVRDSELYKDEKYLDLCPDCYDKLFNFLEGTQLGTDHQEMVGTGEFESQGIMIFEREEDSDG